MHGDFSRGHRPDRKRGKAYRRVLLQQGRPLLDSDFNALADASDQLARDLARDLGGAYGSPDGGFLLTTGPLLARFETLEQVRAQGADFEARIDRRHRYSDQLPSLYLGATRGAGMVTITLRHRLTAAEHPQVRIWARRPWALKVRIGDGPEQSFPASLPEEGFQAYDFPVQPVNAFETLTLRFEGAGQDHEAWIGLIEGLPGAGQGPSLWVTAGRFRVDGLAVELRQDGPFPEVSFPRARGFEPGTLEPGTYVAFLEAWERHVTAVEDPGLLEPALGGSVDTCTRVEAVGQVKLARVEDALAGGSFGRAELEALRAAFAEPAEDSRSLVVEQVPVPIDPGSTTALTTGYTGGENRLYRFEVHEAGPLGTATVKWSRHNGSELFPVLRVQDARAVLALPLSCEVRNGDLIEVLTEAVELGNAADGTLGQGFQFTPPRRARGALFFVREKGLTETERLIELRDVSSKQPARLEEALAGQPGMKLRRWDGFFQTEVGASFTREIEDGLRVKLEGGAFQAGDFWQYEARRLAAESSEPWEPAPHGPERLYAPLALVRYAVGEPVRIGPWLYPSPAATRALHADDVLYDGSAVPTPAASVQEALDELYSRQAESRCQVRLEPGRFNADDGERLSQLIQDRLPEGGVVCLTEGIFTLKTQVRIQGKPIELQGHPGALLVSEVPGDSALHVGQGGRLTLGTVDMVAGAAAGPSLITLARDSEGLAARGCTLLHFDGTAAGTAIAASEGGAGVPSKQSVDVRGWESPLASSAPELRLEGCALVARLGVWVETLLGASLRDTTLLCAKGGLVAYELQALELQGVSFDTGLLSLGLSLGGKEPRERLEEVKAALRTLPAPAPREEGVALYAARVHQGTVRQSAFAADMGLWVGAGAQVRLERNRYAAQDTAVRMDLPSDTVLETESLFSRNVGVHVPGEGRGLRVAHSQIESSRSAVWLRGSGHEVIQNRIQSQGWDSLGAPLGALFLEGTGRSLVEGNTVRLETSGAAICVQASHDARVCQNTVHTSGAGRPLWVLASERVEVRENVLESGGCLASGVQGLTVRGNQLAGALVIQDSASGVVSQNRFTWANGLALSIEGAKERWQLHENFAQGGIRLLPGLQGETPPASEEEQEFHAQMQGNWAKELQVGFLHPDDSGLLSVRDLAIAKPHARSEVHVVANRAESRLVVNHYGRFLITNNAIRELICGTAAEGRIEALNLGRAAGPGGSPGGGQPGEGSWEDAETGGSYGSTVTVLPSGLVLVAGGTKADGTVLDTAYLYAPLRNTWRAVGRMTSKRAHHGAVVLSSGVVLVAGGTNGSRTLASAETFDPVTEQWSAVPSGALVVARQRASVTVLKSGQVLVAGGMNGSDALASTELYEPLSKKWTLLPDTLTVPRCFHTATLLDSGQVLVAGGMNRKEVLLTAELFNPATKQWTLAAAMTTDRARATATVLPSGEVFVAGGWNGRSPVSSVELYDPVRQSWTRLEPMTHARQGHAAAALPSGQVLVLGGRGGSGLAQTSAELYHPGSRTWSSTVDLKSARHGHTATLLGSGRVLVTGGLGQQDTALSLAELYGPAERDWSYTRDLNWARADHAAVEVTFTPQAGGTVRAVLMAGGSSEGGAFLESFDLSSMARTEIKVLDEASRPRQFRAGCTVTPLKTGKVLIIGSDYGFVYDPSQKSFVWNFGGRYVGARHHHTATVLTDGKVLVAGGEGELTTLLFDPNVPIGTNSWSGQGRLSVIRAHHTATLLPSGKVLVAGGTDGAAVLATAELYDPQTGTWSAAARMTLPRSFHTATLLTSGANAGKVLVAGGRDASGVSDASAELYDPEKNAWELTGAMASPREWHTATLLPSGQVLVAGGRDEQQRSLDSVELYDPATGTWSMSVASMQTARHAHVMTLLESGNLLVSGGMQGAQPLSSMELYAPSARPWHYLRPPADLSFGGGFTFSSLRRDEPVVTPLPSGEILITGGSRQTRFDSWKAFEAKQLAVLFDPLKQTWTPVMEGQGAARVGHTATVLPLGRVLVVGGWAKYEGDDGLYPVDTVELYDPATRRWSPTERLPNGIFWDTSSGYAQWGTTSSNRWAHTATLLASGKVLVTGGRGRYFTNVSRNDDVYFSDVNVYDPVSQRWSQVARYDAATKKWNSAVLFSARAHHAAVLLSNGKVLITGGLESRSGTAVSKAGLYDPEDSSTPFMELPRAMKVARQGHTATRLADGKVLIAGGGVASAELYDPAKGSTEDPWTLVGSMKASRTDHFATLLPTGQVLVMGGGSNLVELYDPAKKTWSTLTTLAFSPIAGTALPLGMLFAMAPAPNTSAGTTGSPNTTGVYQQAVGTWASTAPPPTPHVKPAITRLQEGHVLVVGKTAAERYDPITQRWESAGAMVKRDLDSDSATLLTDGRVLVVKRGSAELYSPAQPPATAWSLAEQGLMEKVREGHTATLLPSGAVLVVGGEKRDANGNRVFLDAVELYDPAQSDPARRWVGRKAMARRRSYHTATLLPGLGTQGTVLVLGGFSQGASNADPVIPAELYDIALNSWTSLIGTSPNNIPLTLGGLLGNVSKRITVTLFATGPLAGKVLVVGLWKSDEKPGAAILDPRNPQQPWRETAWQPNARHGNHTATLLPSGKVLIAGLGGHIGPADVDPLYQAELFDPATERWLPAGRFALPRFEHSALLLPTGRVLVVGGMIEVKRDDPKTSEQTLVSTHIPVTTAELYDELGSEVSWLPAGTLET